MSRTSINFFPIHKRGFQVGLMIPLVFLIVMANNYFYYESRDDLARLSLVRLEEVLTGQYESCLDNNIELNVCRDILIEGIEKSWNFGKVSVIDSQGNILIEKERENYKEDRSVVVHSGDAGSANSKISFVLSKRSSPPLYKSSLRSMFLSFWEIPNAKDPSNFFIDIAMKRSSPLWFSIAGIGLLLIMQSLADKQRRRIYDKIEAENFIVSNDLDSTREKLKMKLASENVLNEKIKSMEKSENELLEDYYKELSQLQREIEETKSREIKLIAEQESTIKQLERIKPAQTDNRTRIVEEILLKNPKIEKRAEPFAVNDGIHHSRGFVEQVAHGIAKDELSSRLITKVNSTAYSPARLGQAILEWDRNKQIFILNVYDHEDAGYGAELVLTKDAAQAAYIAKYLVTGKNYLAKKGYSLKFGKFS